MDMSNYTNHLTYPIQQEYVFECEVVSPSGNAIKVRAMDEEAFRDARRKYELEKRRIYELFKKDLLEYLDITGHPKSEILFKMAWDREHHNGYKMVLAEARELIELLDLR